MMGIESNINCKKLSLITPNYARSLGLSVEEPVLVSFTDSTGIKPFIYQAGHTLKILNAPYFDTEFNNSEVTIQEIVEDLSSVHSRPRYGISYFKEHKSVINGSAFWSDMKLGGFVAILEPKGKIIEHEDYFFAFNRITDEVLVTEILVFCVGCRDKSLREGIIVNHRNGYLFPACGLEKHKMEFTEPREILKGQFRPPLSMPEWRFTIDEMKGLILKDV